MSEGEPPIGGKRSRRGVLPRGLFGKYALTIATLVIFVLAVNGIVEAWIIYREATSSLVTLQRQMVEVIAHRSDVFLSDLERRISWVTRASAITLKEKQSDYILLLKQVPAVSKLMFVDGEGRQRLRANRKSSQVGIDRDLAQDPVVIQALSQPVTLQTYVREGEPSALALTMAHAGSKAGATIAFIDLAALSSLSETTAGANEGYAYLLSPQGVVVSASKNSPIAVGADLTGRPDIRKVLVAVGQQGQPIFGADEHSVVRSAARVGDTQWVAVIEKPFLDALRPLTDFLLRFAWLMLVGLALAVLAGLLLARRLIGPIRALDAGAAKLAAGHFDHRIAVRTGDELEALASQFNRMAADLAGSYGRLEVKVEERTRELAQSVRELEALEKSGRALSSSLDLVAVLATVVTRATELTHADAAAIYSRSDDSGVFQLAETQGLAADFKASASQLGQEASRALSNIVGKSPVCVIDIADATSLPAHAQASAGRFRSALIVALDGGRGTRDVLALYRGDSGDVSAWTPDVMRTFAHQSVLAIHNARLFQELMTKGRQLELANAHRTQFFANMSHELRTPLNAVLGYSELLYDGLYGDLPDRAVGVLDRIQANGKHLLGLINDVLDITKMEAGALTLSLSEYSMQALVEGAFAATEALAKSKGLRFEVDVAEGMPLGRGDDRRLTQVLLNLVGNAVKFTDHGAVHIAATLIDNRFRVAVSDTGPGISPEQQSRIFDEFQQVDDASTRKKGGTGLGLSISRRLLEMHGGHIEVQSAPGEGATFTLVVPIRAVEQRQVA